LFPNIRIILPAGKKLPAGDVMLMLFVPLPGLMVPP
jgi:hypothetical protein